MHMARDMCPCSGKADKVDRFLLTVAIRLGPSGDWSPKIQIPLVYVMKREISTCVECLPEQASQLHK